MYYKYYASGISPSRPPREIPFLEKNANIVFFDERRMEFVLDGSSEHDAYM